MDPLDGTREYIAKTGDFAVMIGLTRHHQPVLGNNPAAAGCLERVSPLRCKESRSHGTPHRRYTALSGTVSACAPPASLLNCLLRPGVVHRPLIQETIYAAKGRGVNLKWVRTILILNRLATTPGERSPLHT